MAKLIAVVVVEEGDVAARAWLDSAPEGCAVAADLVPVDADAPLSGPDLAKGIAQTMLDFRGKTPFAILGDDDDTEIFVG